MGFIWFYSRLFQLLAWQTSFYAPLDDGVLRGVSIFEALNLGPEVLRLFFFKIPEHEVALDELADSLRPYLLKILKSFHVFFIFLLVS